MDTESQVKLRGPIVKDPEYKILDDGGRSCKLVLPLAVSGKKEKEELNTPFWLQVTGFGALADEMQKLHKGETVEVEGRLHASRYEGKKGDLRASLGIICHRVGWYHGIGTSTTWLIPVPMSKVKVAAADQPALDKNVDQFLHGQAAEIGPKADESKGEAVKSP